MKWLGAKDIKAVLKTYEANHMYVRTEKSLMVPSPSGVCPVYKLDQIHCPLLRAFCCRVILIFSELPFFSMDSFEVFVTDQMIIECVCRKRAAEAAKRHEAHHNHAISLDFEVPEVNNKVYQLTPPRKDWIKLGGRRRFMSLDEKVKQTISTADRTFKSCLLTIERDRKNGVDKPYLRELEAFIDGVKERIRNSEYSIETPKIIPIFKKRKKDAPDEYRPICLFSNLYDSVIIILANRYLSRIFDGFFYEDSLAFRPRRSFHGEMITTFHHEAIKLVTDYLKRMKRRRIYVAECDMQKFYDTVNHDIVKFEYGRLMGRVKESNPDVSFEAITRIFHSYLDSYNFADSVWEKNNNPEYWARYNIQCGKAAFGWVKEYQVLAESPRTIMPRVGVPQGGALSGLIANIVINRVDEKMVQKLMPKHDLYVRYCDDMLLLSTNRKRCTQLFRLYSKEIKHARLMPHDPVSTDYGTPKYWEAKTKKVYQWISNDKSLGSRWIGFVGYEISRDGEVRIRKSSVKKEKRKQRRVINDIFKLTYRKHRVNNDSLEYSYRGTLMSMAVGRATLWNYTSLKNELCWVNGFRMLNDNPYVKTQVRDLDRCRNRIIHKANARLDRLYSKVGGKIAKEGDGKKNYNKGDVEMVENRVRYYGLPFSYYYHYSKNNTSLKI